MPDPEVHGDDAAAALAVAIGAIPIAADDPDEVLIRRVLAGDLSADLLNETERELCVRYGSAFGMTLNQVAVLIGMRWSRVTTLARQFGLADNYGVNSKDCR